MLKGFVSGEEKDITRIPMKGKNLFDESSVISGSVIGQHDSQSYGSVATSSVTLTSDYICVNPTKQYAFSCENYDPANNNGRGYAFYDSNKNIISSDVDTIYDVRGNVSLSITAPSNASYVRISYDKNATKLMLNLGSTPLPYGYQEGWEVRDNEDRLIWGREDELQTATGTLPFKGYALPVKVKSLIGNGQQTGTPTPDAPIMPTFCGVRTENLVFVSVDNETHYQNYNQYTISDGTITVTGRMLIGFKVKITPDTAYTVSAVYRAGGALIRIREYTEIPNDWTNGFIRQPVNTNLPSATFTTSSEAEWILVALYSEVVGETVNSILLNAGTEPLPYEPYGWKIPITCAGQTVPVYLGQTQTVRRVKKLVLTGNEDWIYMAGMSGINAYYRFKVGSLNSVVSTAGEKCTHYQMKTISTVSSSTDIGFSMQNSTAYNGAFVAFRPYTISSESELATWKSYLAAQYANGTPVTIWYVLNTEETTISNEPLAKIGDYADELNDIVATLPEIPTTTGQNTLTVDTDLEPSSLTVKGHIKELT